MSASARAAHAPPGAVAARPAPHGLPPDAGLALLAASWLIALAAQLQQPALASTQTHAMLAVTGAAALAAALVRALRPADGAARPRAALGWLLAFCGAAALAFGLTGLRAEARLAERLAAALEGLDLQVTGVIATMPQTGPAGTRFGFEVERAEWRGQPVRLPPRLALGWYNNFQDEALLDDPRDDLRAGQRWRLPLRLKQPHGALNPGGFDVELMWFEQGIGATGYVRVQQGRAAAQRLADDAGYPVQGLRQTVRDAIARRVGDARSAGVLAALVVGDQAAIEREDWDLFRRTGIAHLVSISGVHVTMFAWLAGALGAWAWRRSPRLMQWLPAPVAGRWLGLALATAYALLAGWGVPAQRTVIMLAVAVGLRSLGWRWPWVLVLATAAVVVTAIDPWALLQPGFWLSFAAVALLMVSEPVRGGERPGGAAAILRGHLRTQVVATLGLAPLSLVIFQQLSVVGLVANLFAIPLVTLLITPLALLGMALPPLWTAAGWGVQALTWALSWLAQLPLAVWTAAAPPPWIAVCGLVGALLAVLPAPWVVRGLALPLLLPLLWPPPVRPAEGRFELVAADVGQGTAVLVRTRRHLLVYDTGPQYSRESDAGQRVLLPLLRHRGEPRVDLLVLSHRDSDHVGGAASLLAGHPVAAIRSSLEPGHPLLAGGVPHAPCRAGQRWLWDGVRFEMLHPGDDDVAGARKPNALSCVLKATDAAGRSLLLTGDIEAAQEAALIQRSGDGLASTWLMVPHHGSRTSSSSAFVDAVRPAQAIVQAGYRSRFGHPAPDVLARYTDRGIEVVRSDRCGAWVWHDGTASCTRDVRRRYWHWTAPVGGANVALQPGSGAPSR
ncbi:MAG: DNA internalization-related competence protein ComEC/Rec2 [Burkholderiaceae bacterium]|nr:DNA internalization-related competence protein ComEC/Rec2 [Burkholderiaceae bacterium]